jgi:thiol-disulfide isomerase/thioredoxin
MSSSRTKYENYATYSTYAGSEKNEPVVNERFSNQPPIPPQIRQASQSQPSQQQGQPQGMQQGQLQPQGMQQQQGQQQQEFPHRVKYIDTAKMYELLSNPAHFFVQQQPLRLFIKVSTSWCKPCQMIAPEIKALSNDPKYAGILFVEVNGDELIQDDKLSSKLRVSAVPSFFGFVAGKQVGFEAGIIMKDIVALCDKIINV